MNNDSLDMIISGNLDQPIPLSEAESIFSKIDRVIDKAIETKNGWIAINACQELYQVARLSSISLAKMLYGIISNWDKFGIDENVYAVLTDKLGVHRYTSMRYAEAWETLQSGKIPDEHVSKIIERGIRDVITVTRMLNSGFEPTEEQWNSIANASDRMEFADNIREVTHEEPTERSISPSMEIDGTINVYHLGEKHYVGKLDTSSGIYAVQKTIYRMLIGGGVSRK